MPLSSAPATGTLDPRAVGFWQLTYQSISLIAPAGAMAATLTGAAEYAQGAMPLALLVAVAAAALMVNTTVQFSKHVASAGGFYGFIAHGMGGRWGTIGGLLFLLSYFNIVTNALLFVAGVFVPGVAATLFGMAVPSWLWIPVLFLLAGLLYVLAIRGVRPSLQYAVWTGSLEIVALLVFAVALVVTAGPANTPRVFTLHYAHVPLKIFALGVLLGMFTVSGSSAATSLGEETATPERRIHRAVVVAYLLSSVLFVFLAYALTVAWGPSRMDSFAHALVPGVVLARSGFGFAAAVFLVLLILNSMYAGSLSPVLSSARLVYAMGRDGVLFPAALSELDATRNPKRAVRWVMGAALALSLLAGVVLGPFTGYLILLTASSIALFLGHILANTALAFYARERGLPGRARHLLIPQIANLLVLVVLVATLSPLTFPLWLAPALVLGPCLYAWWWLGRAPAEVVARAGRTNAVVREPPPI
jgi:amino acid transporter